MISVQHGTRSLLHSLVLMGCVGMVGVAAEASADQIHLTFDQQSAGESCKGIGSGRGYVSKERAYSDPNSCVFWIKEGATGWGTWGGTITLPQHLDSGDEVWIRLRMFVPEDFDYTSSSEGSRLKFLRVRTRSASDSNHGYDDIYINPPGRQEPYGFIYEGEQKWRMFGSPKTSINKGTWETWEYYLRFDSVPVTSGGRAIVRVWKNGELILETTERKTLKTAESYATAVYLFTYWNGGSPKTQHLYVDDIVITTSTPGDRDRYGNAFVGVGNELSAPRPPKVLGGK